MSIQDQYIHISTGTIIRFFLVILGIGFIYYVRDILTALIFSIIIASSIEPAVEWLKARKVPRILGVILIYVSIAVLFFFFIYLFFPLLVEELRGLSANFPALREQWRSTLERVETLPFVSFFTQNLEELIQAPSAYVERFGGGFVDFVSVAFGGLASFLIIVVFSFYLAAQENGIENFLRLVTPLSYEPYVIDLWKRSQRTLGRWLRVQLLLGAVVGVLIFFGLTFLGVRNALIFAALAAILEIIPVVGPILAAVPAVLVAWLDSYVLGLSAIALYVVVQQIESHVIVPVVMRKAVGLSPLIVVLALLIGAKIGGIFGILLAVPLTAILGEFLADWDKKKRELVPG